MSEIDAEVVRRLVTGHKNDGRAVYDPQAKAEVVQACLKPGVSVARMALQCGINANLLRRWITQRMGADRKASRADISSVAKASADDFVPLRLAVPEAVAVPQQPVELLADLRQVRNLLFRGLFAGHFRLLFGCTKDRQKGQK